VKPAETQTSIRLANHLVRVPNSRSGGHGFKSPVRQELGALTKSGKTLGVRSFYSGDPDVINDHVSLSGYIPLAAWPVIGRLTLPDATADSTSLPNQAHVKYQIVTGGSSIEEPAENQTSIRLASH
jgi:hypothetical protein